MRGQAASPLGKPYESARWERLAGLVLYGMSAAGCMTAPAMTLQRSSIQAALPEQPQDTTPPNVATSISPESAPLTLEENEPAFGEASTPLSRDDSRLQLEALYHAGGYPWPRDAAERKARIEELERWNQGGLGPSERWHPAPRVVIGEPVLRAGKADTKALMHVLRAEHYWAVRRCYEPELRASPSLEGRTLVHLTISADGVVRASQQAKDRALADKRKHPTKMSEPAVRSCLAAHFKGAKLPRPRGKAQVVFSIDVYPGDALLSTKEGERAEGAVTLTEASAQIEAQRAQLLECFLEATERHPGIWGRMLLRLEIGADGSALAVSEVESTFPDREATRCVSERLSKASFPPPAPSGSSALIIVPLRWQASTTEEGAATDEAAP